MENYLSADDYQELIGKLHVMRFEAGEQIYTAKGNKAMYLILEGLVGMYQISVDPKEYVQNIYFPGEVFPVSLLRGKPRKGEAYAETAATIGRLHIKDFMEFFQTDIRRMTALVKQIANQHTIYSYRVGDLQLRFARDRLIYQLLFLACRLNSDSANTVAIPRFARDTLAQSTNLSREKVSREMNRLVKLGLISYIPKTIVINDIEQLKKQLGRHIDIPDPANLFEDED